MKAYKFEVLVIDHENVGIEQTRLSLENCQYTFPIVLSKSIVDIGEWTDEHPLNRMNTVEEYCDKAFVTKVSCIGKGR
jgi:hypothetical protein